MLLTVTVVDVMVKRRSRGGGDRPYINTGRVHLQPFRVHNLYIIFAEVSSVRLIIGHGIRIEHKDFFRLVAVVSAVVEVVDRSVCRERHARAKEKRE